MPELEALYRQHRERGLTVDAITRYDPDSDEDERRREFAAARRFLRQRGLTFPAAITDGSEIYRANRVRSLPSTVPVDAEGRIVAYAAGLESAREPMREAAKLVTPASGSEAGLDDRVRPERGAPAVETASGARP